MTKTRLFPHQNSTARTGNAKHTQTLSHRHTKRNTMTYNCTTTGLFSLLLVCVPVCECAEREQRRRERQNNVCEGEEGDKQDTLVVLVLQILTNTSHRWQAIQPKVTWPVQAHSSIPKLSQAAFYPTMPALWLKIDRHGVNELQLQLD